MMRLRRNERREIEAMLQQAIKAGEQNRRSVLNELIEHARIGKERGDSESEYADWTLEWLLVMRDEGSYWPTPKVAVSA